jgi:ribosomal protein S18 acetylase RimI-like enzyme
MTGVRIARIADCEAIGRLHVAAWRETYRGLIPDSVIEGYSPEMRCMQWRKGITMGDAGPFVVVANGFDDAIIGFGAAGRARDPALESDAEIYAIYLLQAAQRRGAGQAMLCSLFETMVARGHRSIGLWVFTANAAARRFYERRGGVAGLRREDTSEGWRCDETAYRWGDLTAALTHP